MCHLELTGQPCLSGSHDLTSRTLVRGRVRAVDGDIKVAKVLLVRNCTDSGHTGNVGQIGSCGLSITELAAAYGSAIRRSVSLMILLGKAMSEYPCYCGVAQLI